MPKLNRCNPLVAAIGLSLTLSLAWMPMAQAETGDDGYTHYVTDSIDIPFRSNAGYKYKIKRMLPSGSRVKVLEIQDDGWARLLYNHRGTEIEGWMPSSLIQSQPIASIRLEEQEKRLSKLEKERNQLKVEKSTLNERFESTQAELKKVKKENFQLNKQLEEIESISGDAIKLNEENQQLAQEVASLRNDNAIMKEQIDQSGDVIQRQWFLTGAGVLLLGLLLGRFFRLPSRKNRWNTLN
ncbi:TIGR04211 family SH3 domain-containing protein [Hydrogenovibrio halophilus]|uniref:TIGR04211 family SH3 domain-containing protein n=1 Tax=Hydrogenovibrio halophilus TaxID=373391 RepID=UPI0003603FA0|nr:TIGR04211 family SH3 domain-containing protein [Hydrogenovibrio halophilus]